MKCKTHPLIALCRRRSPLLLAALLSACASYQPLPLDKSPSLKVSLSELRHDGPLPPWLGVDDLALLAVENNPDLVAARVQARLADAQVRAAGILPNPSLGGNYGFFLGGPGFLNSISASLSEDVKSLVTLSAKRAAADAAALQIDASILWQEWQVVGKVRLLAVDLVEGDKSLALSRQTLDLMQARLHRSRQALGQGDTTLTALAPDVIAVNDLHRQIDDLARQQAQRRSDLDALLGLSGTAVVPLRDRLEVPEIDPRTMDARLADLPDRRPDLIALQLGYRAQEAKVRGAILAQFPALTLGMTGSRDNSDVRTLGPQITIELPIFDRNQGNIAVEQATREQLHAEFTARLAAVASELQALATTSMLIEQQLARARPQAAELAAVAARAQAAYAAGNLDERAYVDFAAAELAGKQILLALEQVLLEHQVAIATLTSAGMPSVERMLEVP